MDAFNEKIKKLFKGKKGTSIHFSLEGDPGKDWIRLCIGFVVLVLIILAFNGYLFFEINKGDIFAAPQIIPPTADNASNKNLGMIVDYYTAKAESFNSLDTSLDEHVVDPAR